MEMETVHIKYSYMHTHRPGGARRSTGSTMQDAGCTMREAYATCDVTYVMRYDAEASDER